MSVLLILLVVVSVWTYIVLARADRLPAKIRHAEQIVRRELGQLRARSSEAKNRLAELVGVQPAGEVVTLHLTSGARITGRLVADLPSRVTIRWRSGEVTFLREEIARIEHGAEGSLDEILLQETAPGSAEAWPYQHDLVVQLTNLVILDARVERVDGDHVIVTHAFEEGGVMEQTLDRARIERLRFRPIDNERSLAIEEALRDEFPDMAWYDEGLFTIITDSYATWVREYRKTIRGHVTDFYLHCLPLFKERTPRLQHYIVIFDRWEDFVTHALADGVPGWGVAGYFSPETEVLYLFNFLGDEAAAALEEVYLGRYRRAIDDLEAQMKAGVDPRYHVFLDGQLDDVKGRFESAHGVLRSQSRAMTLSTLRHELTHELFHHWGLQTVRVSTIKPGQEDVVDRERAVLEEGSVEGKAALFLGLLQREERLDRPELEAANSWFVEGLAAYSETVPVGSRNDRWLYLFQEARRRDRLLPLEQLTVYAMGSFPGVAPEAMVDAYAQSWAFVHFLMHRERDAFLTYLDQVTRESPANGQDLAWLLEATGTTLRSLERDFLAYMEAFEEIEDPDLALLDIMLEVLGR